MSIRQYKVGTGSVSVWGDAGAVYVAGCFDTEAEAACAVRKLADLGVTAQYRETEAGWNVF